MNWNSLAIVRGGFHTRAYDTREVVYVAKRVLLFVGGTSIALDEPVANERDGWLLEDAGGLSLTYRERSL